MMLQYLGTVQIPERRERREETVNVDFDYNRIDLITVMRLRLEPRAHNVTTPRELLLL